MAKVLIAESLDAEGVELLKRQPDLRVDVKTDLSHDELVQAVGEYEALIVRSGAQVTNEVIQAGKNLQVIARAGVGVGQHRPGRPPPPTASLWSTPPRATPSQRWSTPWH